MSLMRNREPLIVTRSVQHSIYVILLTLMLWVFLSNLYDGVRLLYMRRHTRGTRLYVPILNIIPNLACCFTSAFVLIQRVWPGFTTCEVVRVLDVVSLAFGTSSIVAILFIRVYYAWMRHRWLLYLGGVLILATFVVGVTGFFALSMYADEKGTCLTSMDKHWSLAKFGTDIATNLTLSGLYLFVLGQMLRRGFSTALYEKLRHEGMLSAFLVVISAIITAVIVLLDLASDHSVYIYGVDLLISATLINQMLCKNRGSGNQKRSAGQLQFRRVDHATG
ncbi:hypothetical protein THASP1DRAFT_29132 [Thamnocephalis sphaerospora]|uniref:G-protein coupled receptors family 1 profile domain-containing protein n=1 Tax=Thamnocephalis sphaerospora TaxID=78915 RepID=A0A4P9XSH2_9FUNG|nr:hypothetical protein THASP1DRAFT_29132 [Thamnocephalis sphaerospora]|eukprot:RKP09075.1 hypothetical protein THASP1DRAFT_29132 [Thamnocephalis sphaerospora]